MNPLHQYEACLDQLDTHLTIQRNAIVLELLSEALHVPLAECRNEAGIIQHGTYLVKAIQRNSPPLPERYLVGRFVRLACQANRLDFDQDALVAAVVKIVTQGDSLPA